MSEKGAARQAAYDKTEKGAARKATYAKTEKGAVSKAANQQKLRDEDYSATKQKQNDWKAAERTRKRKANVDQLVKSVKKMKLVTEEDRRLDFQKATLLSADFVCLCCQNHYFQESVIPVTDKLLNRLVEKDMPQELWMADPNVYTKVKVQKASAKVLDYAISNAVCPLYYEQRIQPHCVYDDSRVVR